MICDKEAFASYKEGVVKIISLSKRKGGKHKYKLYKCHYCGSFHVTTINRPLKDGHEKFEKYPFNFRDVKKHTPLPKPTGMPMAKEKPIESWFAARQPVLTPLQAEILKHKIEANNKAV